jgi:hypothetical protein
MKTKLRITWCKFKMGIYRLVRALSTQVQNPMDYIFST